MPKNFITLQSSISIKAYRRKYAVLSCLSFVSLAVNLKRGVIRR